MVYTLNGQLKSINHPSLDGSKDPGKDGEGNSNFAPDVFGMALDYHYNDYVRSNKQVSTSIISSDTAGQGFYSGLIHAQRYKTRAMGSNGADYLAYGTADSLRLTSSTTDELMNRYTYDELYRLGSSVFGTYNNSSNTFSGTDFYKEYGNATNGGIGYDKNGNITTLERNNYLGTGMDNLAYSYTSGTNQLASITDSVATHPYNDFNTASGNSFSYNAIGQMTASAAEAIDNMGYTLAGKTSLLHFSNGNSTAYTYNDRGIKLKAAFYDSTANKTKYTWYVSDAGGNTLAMYEYDEAETTPTFRLTEQPVYGAGRIGVLNKATGITSYEITDHLGNVRATVHKGISGLEMDSWQDYYAFGGTEPGRKWNTSRYSYQGQENVENSKWLNFELRTYNADLGRFNNPDPYSQFASSYVGMGNNPVSGVDPTGGFVNFSQSGDGSFVLPGRADAYISYDAYYKNVVVANAYSMQSYERDFQNLSRKYYPRTWYNGREEINSPEGNNVLAYRHELFALQASYGINPMTTGIANSGIDFDATADAYTYKVWGDIDRAKRDEFYAEKAARREAFEQKKREATQKAAEMLAKMFPANVDLMASLSGGGIERSVESIVRYINDQPVGFSMTGDEIAKQNSKLGLASTFVDNIGKVNGGIQVNLTWTGRMAIKAAPNLSVPNGSVFGVENVTLKDGSNALKITAPGVKLYGAPLGVYIKGNTFSRGGEYFNPIFPQ